MTLGEYRVGLDFNPSGSGSVHEIKRRAADLIDMIAALKPIDPVPEGDASINYLGEFARLKAHAMTLVEDAAMNAVKAATKKSPTAKSEVNAA